MGENESDEITIDFSKIKNIFKKKKPKKEPSPEKKEESSSKHESAAKHEKKAEHKEEKHTEKETRHEPKEKEQADPPKGDSDLNFDFGKIISLFKNPKFYILLLLIIPLIFTYTTRTVNYGIPQTDTWAANTIDNNIRNNIAQQINAQYPNLPEQNKQNLINEQYVLVKEQEKENIKTETERLSNEFKSYFQFENGDYYMPDIDPYFYLRFSRNIEEIGHGYDELRDGVPWDNHMLAPIGNKHTKQYHSTVLYYTYRAAKIFDKDITVMGGASLYAIIFSLLSIIPAFFIGRKLGDNTGGFFAAMLIAVSTAGINRTLWGHADTDAYQLFFPLLTIWLLVESISRKHLWSRVLLAGLTGLSMAAYSLFWQGYWYIFNFIYISLLGYIAYLLLVHRKNLMNFKKLLGHEKLRNMLVIFATFIGFTGIFVTLFTTFSNFKNAFMQPFYFVFIKSASHSTLWPNIFTTVAELNEASMSTIVNSASSGFNFLFFLALFGLILMLFRKQDFKEKEYGLLLVSLAYLVVVWVLATKAPIFLTIVLLLGLIGYLIYAKKSLKLIFFISSGVFYLILIKKVVSISTWLNQSIGVSKGNLIFLLLILLPVTLALLYMIINKIEYNVMLSILLIVWFIGTIFASTKGVRFILLLVPGFAVAVGVCVGRLVDLISKYFIDNKGYNKTLVTAVVIVVFLFFLISPIRAGHQVGKGDIPIINDVWYNSLTEIRDNSDEDAILTSWWDFGHHFKYYADRAVTFDGGSQNSGPAHWAGKLFLVDDEQESIGILRMLDCGHRMGPDTLDEHIGDLPRTIEIINEMIMLDKDGARDVLFREGLSPADADEILQYTHCEPPEAFVIASEDMIGKAGVWGHFGSWDFERAKIWKDYKGVPQQKAVEGMMDEFGYSREDAQRIYSEISNIFDERTANTWIAPWPNYASGMETCREQSPGLLACGVGVVINTTTMDVFMGTQEGPKRPSRFSYWEDGEFVIDTFEDDTTPFGVTMVDRGGSLSTVIAQVPLDASMFSRMFYHEGRGLKHYKLFYHERGLTGTDVYVYKVDWDGIEDEAPVETEEDSEETSSETETVEGGLIASSGDSVLVDYIGYLEDGEIFDSSIIGWQELDVSPDSSIDDFDSTRPLGFTVGAGQMIRGFDAGVEGMEVGEEKVIEVSPEEGYGNDPSLHPLGGKTLFFKVKLVSIG